jgi:hypothetical protein
MSFKGLKVCDFSTSVMVACMFCLALTHTSANASPNLILDGSFELGGNEIESGTNGGFIEQGNWAVITTPNMTPGVFPNSYNTNQFFSTTSGSHFLMLSYDPHTKTHFPNCAVAQAIGTHLTAGATYQISFKECCYKDPTVPTNGSVNVELVPTHGGIYVYNNTFSVNQPAKGWKIQKGTVTVPSPDPNEGAYTLVFIANSQARVAIIDDISFTAE